MQRAHRPEGHQVGGGDQGGEGDPGLQERSGGLVAPFDRQAGDPDEIFIEGEAGFQQALPVALGSDGGRR